MTVLFAAQGGSVVELRGFGSHSRTFRDSGRARRVDKKGCGWSEIVASGVDFRRVMIRLHLQFLPNPVNPTYRPNQRPPQQVAPTASVQNFSPVEPARAGWSCRLSCVWVCSCVPSGKFRLAKEFLAANLEPRGLFEMQVLL